MLTSRDIGVDIGGVLDEPRLAFLKIGAELAVLRRHAADLAIENANGKRLLRHCTAKSPAPISPPELGIRRDCQASSRAPLPLKSVHPAL